MSDPTVKPTLLAQFSTRLPQARREIQELLNVDGASIVAAEAAYLRQQAVQIPVLEAETAALTACRHCASDGHAAAV